MTFPRSSDALPSPAASGTRSMRLETEAIDEVATHLQVAAKRNIEPFAERLARTIRNRNSRDRRLRLVAEALAASGYGAITTEILDAPDFCYAKD
jgi:hypothetical protein